MQITDVPVVSVEFLRWEVSCTESIRYWCLRWLLQENISTTGAQVIKENLVKLDHLPLVARITSLPELSPEMAVEVEISQIDLLELTFHAKFLRKLDA